MASDSEKLDGSLDVCVEDERLSTTPPSPHYQSRKKGLNCDASSGRVKRKIGQSVELSVLGILNLPHD